MDNYKIKVKDEAESKETQELFFELGFRWEWTQDKEVLRSPIPYLFTLGERIGCGFDLTKFEECAGKELTLPQLRDIVVLKRNDVRDATHTDGDRKGFLSSEGVEYFWNVFDSKWFIPKVMTFEAEQFKPIKKHLESATGRFDENGVHHLTFSNGAEEKDQGLISGAEALADITNVQHAYDCSDNWYTTQYSTLTIPEILKSKTSCGHEIKFRLKPQTIKLELELPKPFEPKHGEMYWWIDATSEEGYSYTYFDNNKADQDVMQFGAYRTEDDVKKAVEQLRKIRGAS
ncbi:hypothetical protein [Acinetobacter lactucae]|uniref:hypothetical protein n=1 Tax=Acinetobacter lactucae TaxID=1785128 RepID=UPI00157FC29F|nr:hypothetical protein [Acinetobacter lactucae]NUG49693.1 hypothetical protein [Acinetobacter lactucae]